MRIGIDLDNTIVCYDVLFSQLAIEAGLSIPVGGARKSLIREHFVALGRESEWTRLQGLAYGTRMLEAVPFPGVVEFVRDAQLAGHELFIVSHKTRFAIAGERIDLREAAVKWIGHYLNPHIPVPFELEANLFFADRKDVKLDIICSLGLTAFIDDLQEILLHPKFPGEVQRVWFAASETAAPSGTMLMSDWRAPLSCLNPRSVETCVKH